MTLPLPSSRRSSVAHELLLPLWKRVVFVDWFGVLSDDLLWHSVLGNEAHPYHRAIDTATTYLFRQRSDVIKDWMRGNIDAAAVVARIAVPEDRRFRADFLLKRLFHDCRTATASHRAELLTRVRQAVSDACIVIATDNMDCFASQISRESLTRLGADAVLVSSDLGVLKTDSIERFFGPWLRNHALTFREAVLIDDNPATCRAFQMCGGTSIVFETIDGTIEKLGTLSSRETES